MILPKTKYTTIVIDPPWPMTKIPRSVRPNQKGFNYKTMAVSDITDMDILKISSNNAFCFLWTTQKYLADALTIIGMGLPI